jgi:hypothetical protein
MVDEVSMMLYLKPSTAHPDRDSEFKGEFKQTMGPKLKALGLGIARVGGVEFKDVAVKVLTITKDVTDTASWAGEEKGWNMDNCSREIGEKIIELASDYIAEFIEEFAKVKIPPPTKFP